MFMSCYIVPKVIVLSRNLKTRDVKDKKIANIFFISTSSMINIYLEYCIMTAVTSSKPFYI